MPMFYSRLQISAHEQENMGAWVSITLPGEPVGKGRPRVGRSGTLYTPAKTRAFEAALALQAKAAVRGRRLDGPISVQIWAAVGIPESWSKKRKAAALAQEERPTRRPDVDNFIKAALDGLNGIVWADDSQVVDIRASKFYSDKPYLRIDVECVGAPKGCDLMGNA